jgi:outer membrane protein TolC
MSSSFSFQSRRTSRRRAHARQSALLAFILTATTSPIHAHAGDALSFARALDIAEAQAPQIEAQSAAVRAAAGEAERAPQLPDPQLIAGVENLPVDGPDQFSLTRDFMTMRKIGVMQEFPRGEKRRLRGELADADVRKEEAELGVRRLDVRRETAAAWIERYVAERERELLIELRAQANLTVAAAQASFKGGKGNSANVIAATADRVQLDDRIDAASRDVEQATATLARWIGAEAASAPLGEPPDFATLASAPAMLLQTGEHAALRPYDALETRAEKDVALARAEKSPDWSVEVTYAQRGPSYSNMMTVEFRVGLPLFATHRQDPAIAAKVALLDRVRAEREDVMRVHREETSKALAAWTTAQKRLKRTENEWLPLANERADVALAAYRAGGDLQAVIAARTAQVDARIAYVTQLGDLARAWTALNYLLPAKEQP